MNNNFLVLVCNQFLSNKIVMQCFVFLIVLIGVFVDVGNGSTLCEVIPVRKVLAQYRHVSNEKRIFHLWYYRSNLNAAIAHAFQARKKQGVKERKNIESQYKFQSKCNYEYKYNNEQKDDSKYNPLYSDTTKYRVEIYFDRKLISQNRKFEFSIKRICSGFLRYNKERQLRLYGEPSFSLPRGRKLLCTGLFE